jgi:hypothetical protein
MDTKQLAGITVFVLVFGIASNSLVNHAFADSMKSNAGNTKLIQNTVSDKPENKNDKTDTVKSTPTGTSKTDSKTDKSTNPVNKVKTDSKVVKNTSHVKPKHPVKTTNHYPTTTTPKIATTTSKDKTITDKPENKNDKADTVKSTK